MRLANVGGGDGWNASDMNGLLEGRIGWRDRGMERSILRWGAEGGEREWRRLSRNRTWCDVREQAELIRD